MNDLLLCLLLHFRAYRCLSKKMLRAESKGKKNWPVLLGVCVLEFSTDLSLQSFCWRLWGFELLVCLLLRCQEFIAWVASAVTIAGTETG